MHDNICVKRKRVPGDRADRGGIDNQAGSAFVRFMREEADVACFARGVDRCFEADDSPFWRESR